MTAIGVAGRIFTLAVLLAAHPGSGLGAEHGPGEGILVDQLNRPVPASALKGHYLLVYFGYTSCPDVCPVALATMSRALSLLGPGGDGVLPLFVTVDPARDTPDVLRSYVAHFDPRLVGLTGSAAAVAAARKAFGVQVSQRPADANGNYALDHGLFIYFANPDGKVLSTFHASQSAAVIAEDVRRLMSGGTTAEGGDS